VLPARARPASLCTAPPSLAVPCCCVAPLVSSPLSSDLTTTSPPSPRHRIAPAHHAAPNSSIASPHADRLPLLRLSRTDTAVVSKRGNKRPRGSIAIALTHRHRCFNTYLIPLRLHLLFQAAVAQIACINTALRTRSLRLLYQLCDRSSDSDCAHCAAPPIAVQRNHQHGARRDRSRWRTRCAR
jgi:hypothetical protein